MIEITLPIRTCSEANMRGHWAKRARRARKQRDLARFSVQANFSTLPSGKLRIRLSRIAPRKLDSDNLAAALKAIRDGVADALGMDDGDPRILWRYDQQQGKPGEYAVKIEIKKEITR